MKYIIYARKSSEGEDRQVQSLDDQINVLQKIAYDRNLEVVDVLRESQSAKKPGRPIFEDVLARIESGEVEGILTWKLDRLSRNPIDAGRVQWLLQQGVIAKIVTPDSTYSPDDNAIIFALESGMANQYIRELSKNIRRGVKSKLEKGDWPNLAPLGYLNKDKKIVIDEDKSPYVRKAFELYSCGNISIKDLSDNLFNEGFRSRSGKKYYKSKLHKILSNPFYYGIMFIHDEYYVGNHKPLISKELFDRVQDVLAGKNHSKKQKHDFAYRGLMQCAKCSCSLTATKKKGYTYYYCTNGKGSCDQHKKYLREEKIEILFANSLQKFDFDEKFVEMMYLASKERRQSTQSYKESITNNLSKELYQVSVKRERLLEGFCSDVISKEVYKAKEDDLKREEVNIKNQIKRSESETVNELATLEQQKKVFLTACTLHKKFLVGKTTEKKNLLKTVLWNATLQNEKIAQLSLNRPYEMIFECEDLSDFSNLRRGRDSNPREP